MTIAITNAMIPKEMIPKELISKELISKELISKEMIPKATKTIVKGGTDGTSDDNAAYGRLENDSDGCAHAVSLSRLRWKR